MSLERLIRQNSTVLNTSIHCSCQPRTKFSFGSRQRKKKSKKRHTITQHLVLIFTEYIFTLNLQFLVHKYWLNLIRLMESTRWLRVMEESQTQWHSLASSNNVFFFPALKNQKIFQIVWKSPKMSHLKFFRFWHFPPIFVLLKLTCLVTLFDRKL